MTDQKSKRRDDLTNQNEAIKQMANYLHEVEQQAMNLRHEVESMRDVRETLR